MKRYLLITPIHVHHASLHHVFFTSHFTFDNDDMKSSKHHVASLLSVFKTYNSRLLTGLIVTSTNIAISAHGEKRKTVKPHRLFQNNWVFSHDVTKIQTR